MLPGSKAGSHYVLAQWWLAGFMTRLPNEHKRDAKQPDMRMRWEIAGMRSMEQSAGKH